MGPNKMNIRNTKYLFLKVVNYVEEKIRFKTNNL